MTAKLPDEVEATFKRPSFGLDEPLFSQREVGKIVKAMKAQHDWEERKIRALKWRIKTLTKDFQTWRVEAQTWSDALASVLRDRVAGHEKSSLSEGEMIELREFFREMGLTCGRRLRAAEEVGDD